MKFYEFGNTSNPTIMCLPGNFMTHRQFENIVPTLIYKKQDTPNDGAS